MAEKINEEGFNKISSEMFNWIKRICAYLPCPDCSQHATDFLSKVQMNKISNKNDFKNMLYVFHNVVNTRKTKALFNYSEMEKYKNNNIIATYNNFTRIYNTRGNMKLLTESFQRQLIIKDFKQWIMAHAQYFR
jgi:hypothetical protein